MVRNIVGVLVLVGMNKINPFDMKHLLEQKNNKLIYNQAPSYGLYLCNVLYENNSAINYNDWNNIFG